MNTVAANVSYFLGLDIGSTTAKLVILGPHNELIFSAYERHLSEPRTLLTRLLSEAAAILPGLRVKGACTGSGGIALAKALGLEFVQEVIASTTAVQELIPHTSVAIELGGEDAKITFFEGNIEQRMNETCAGGTGAFIDQMASYLQTDAAGLNELAQKYTTIYPIASRCGVFAKTDVLPLLNEGAARENIAASIFQAVVDQTVGGLACGRAIRGNVAFLGGPLYFLSELRKRFEETLDLTPEQSVFPSHAQYFVAMGAALEAGRAGSVSEHSLQELAEAAKNMDEKTGVETVPLPPLFDSEDELAEFRRVHSREVAPRAELEKAVGPLYLGFDAGSTTIKAVLMDDSGAILHTYYSNNKGVPLSTAVNVLKEIYQQIPEGAWIAHCGATGYGAGLLKAALGVEVDEVETVAHYRAARFLRPNVSFVLDIGGQDMKCLHIKDGIIDRIMLNEACSAGCGVFIETFAKSLGMEKEEFAERALRAAKPVDLGSRCTVFMNSKIKQAQKEGAGVEDIAAGLAYSVIRNALYKVIKVSGPEDLGPLVVAQGGSFLNDALLRAFEKLMGCEVFRPDIAGLMGAYGVALIARDAAHKLNNPELVSTLVTANGLKDFTHQARTTRCRLCGNRCLLTVNIFPNGRYITGNRCEKGAPEALAEGAKYVPENLYARKYQMLFSAYTPLDEDKAPRGLIGIPRVLNMYDRYPYWFTFFNALGFRVVLSSPSSPELYAKGMDTISSQSVCYPAKLAHGHIMDLVEKGVKHIFYPCIPREEKEDHTADDSYNCPVVSGYPEVLRLNMGILEEKGVTLHCPFLQMGKFNSVLNALLEEFRGMGISRREMTNAMYEAGFERDRFRAEMRRLGDETLHELEKTGRLGVVLTGHPYHLDPAINHGIPELIVGCGVAVLTEDSIAHLAQVPRPLRVLDQWPYHSR
ncbi:MAG: 2-hydroxyglutaryl-CoA dehydratase, partial [Desulfovibrionaceae bacterium]|nr:2-hydroxyglutaryl-CoA dehydratase [Desulfovibrionaceae bacterium]